MKENKSNFKAVYIFIFGLALFIFGGYWLTQHTTILTEKIPGNSEVIKDFNKNVKGDVSLVEVGTVLTIPEEVKEIMRAKASKMMENEHAKNIGFTVVPSNGVNSQPKYSPDFKFEKIFFANLKPKYLSDFYGSMYLYESEFVDKSSYDSMYTKFCMNYLAMGDTDQTIEQQPFFDKIINDTLYDNFKDITWEYLSNTDNYFDIFHDNMLVYSRELMEFTLDADNYKYSKYAEKYKFGPDAFNGSEVITENTIITFIPTSVEKISENKILVNIEVDKPVTDRYIAEIVRYIGGKWTQNNPNGYKNENNHVFIKIYDKDIKLENFGGYGIYCVDTEDWHDKYFDAFRWYPNEQGIKLITEYFKKIEEYKNNGKIIIPSQILSDIAKSEKLDYFDVVNCVLSYIYMMTN